MSPALNYKALLYATPTHLPSICPFTRPHVIISALSMHLPPELWAWIRAPATHFLGARILTTLPLSIPPAAFSALPQHLPSPFSVIILSSQYLFQRGPIWVMMTRILLALIYVQNIIIIPHLAVTQLMRVIEWPLSDSYGSCVNKNARVLIKGFTAYNTLKNFSRKHCLILSYFWIKNFGMQ